MTLSLYNFSVPPLVQSLGALDGVFQKSAAHARDRQISDSVFLTARLYPDMFPLSQQVFIACRMARNLLSLFTGGEESWESSPQGLETFANLQEIVAETKQKLLSYPKNEVDAAIEKEFHVRISRDKTALMSAPERLSQFALPHFYFHISMTYAILRHNGVPLGKQDFIGLVPRKTSDAS